MPLKTKIAKLEDVAEPLRELYEEKDGAFVLKVEGDAGDVFPGLIANQQTLLSEKKTLADKLKALEGQLSGIDLEKAKKALEAADQAEAEKLKLKGDWDTREKQLKEQLANDLKKHQDQFATELKQRDDRIAKLQSSLEKNLIEAQATTAIAAAKGVPELLLPHVMRAVKVVEENGEFVARVMDSSGQPRIADVKGTPFTIANLVDEMRGNQVFGRAFEASGNGGSGADPNNKASQGGTKTVRRGDQDALNNNIEAIAKGEITVIE
jgi:hypothetical protein